MQSLHYKCRVDSHDEQLLYRITRSIQCYSVCYENNEDGTNPHMHMYIKTPINNQTLRKRIVSSDFYLSAKQEHLEAQSKFPEENRKKWNGNSYYSLRELTPDSEDPQDCPYLKYHAYMAKVSEPTYVGFSVASLSAMKLQIEVRNKAVKAEIAERKAKRRTVLQQMEDEFGYDKDGKSLTLDVNMVCRDVCNFYRNHGKLVREFAMISQVQTLLLKYLPRYQNVLECNISKSVNKSMIN